MGRIETVSDTLKVIRIGGAGLPAQQPVVEEEAQVEEAVAVVEAPVAEEKPVAKPRRKRARKADGKFQEDNPATPLVDEAWVNG